jgi:small subunit ribosomal protein S9
MQKQNQKYYYAKGRRKTSVAGVRIYEGKGAIMVNHKPIEEYFKWENDRREIMAPLKTLELTDKVYFTVRAAGGGVNGQKGATIHALARALVKMDEEFKSVLKKNGFLTRDDRMVERKHTGLIKARKGPQYSKR